MAQEFFRQEEPSETVTEEDSFQAPQENVEESYWNALLVQGEYSSGGEPDLANGKDWSGEEGLDGVSTLSNTFSQASRQDWELATFTFENDKSVSLNVTGYNRGGLLVTWNSLRGFVPASQLVDFPIDVEESARRVQLARYIGNDLLLRIIELDIDTNRLILSERAAQAEPGQRAEVLHTLSPNTIHEGTVTNLCDFGAFVDLGGVEGLIHISELSWGRVNHPRDVLKSGQSVKVFVMSVDSNDERIALSLKRLQPDPWATVEQRYDVGQEVTGVITNVVDFGAFACIEEGLEGLIHISELAEGQFLHPRNVVQEGDTITAQILNINGPSRRLGLTLRKPEEDTEETSEQA